MRKTQHNNRLHPTSQTKDLRNGASDLLFEKDIDTHARNSFIDTFVGLFGHSFNNVGQSIVVVIGWVSGAGKEEVERSRSSRRERRLRL
jgi:hypothetical protein